MRIFLLLLLALTGCSGVDCSDICACGWRECSQCESDWSGSACAEAVDRYNDCLNQALNQERAIIECSPDCGTLYVRVQSDCG